MSFAGLNCEVVSIKWSATTKKSLVVRIACTPGMPGDKGPTGDKGVTGDKGPPGDKGATGDKGLPGDKGITGDKGLTGDKGSTGDKGANGDAGGSVIVFEHGSNAAAIRPVTTAPVFWSGTVQPNNWVNGDVWLNTSSGGGTPSPTMPSNIVANWSAGNLALTEGATVNNWTDSVGSLALVATGSPTYLATEKAVRYDGSTARHDATLAMAQPTTTIVLFRMPVTTASVPIIGSNTSIHSLSTSSASFFQANNGTALARPNALSANQWYMGVMVANGSSSSVQIGTETPTTGNTGTNARSSVRVASNTAASAFGRIDVKAILLFNRVLISSEIADVKTLLQNEHGLTL